MRFLKLLLLALLICILLITCNKQPSLREEVMALKKEWGFEFPLPSKNDTINLLHIQMEKSYFTFKREKMDSLANRILAIDSTFYMALAFQAFQKWPFDLEKLKKARKYALKDTTIQQLIFAGDYSYWVEHDTIAICGRCHVLQYVVCGTCHEHRLL